MSSNKNKDLIILNKERIMNKDEEDKKQLRCVFKNCLDILRAEHLIGEKALRALALLLDLRLLEPHIGKTINIEKDKYDFNDILTDDMIEKLIHCVKFSVLAEKKEDNIPNIMDLLWDNILSQNEITKNIFKKGRGFEITNQATYKKIIDQLKKIDFESIEVDILGEIYEEVIQDVMKGKTLGQFFTPTNVKKMMVKLINPKIFEDGKTETVFDPAMGTGGFLITCARHFIKDAKEKKIKLDWEFISNKGLGGREAEPDTYQLAVSNMMISTGHMFKVLENGDSIRDSIKNKYDIVLANPPFGIKGLKYDEIKDKMRNEYLPIKSENAVSLFMQAIINILKINGKCAVVLPDGQDLFSKSNKTLIAVRELLLKTCELKKIIYLPAGIFTHTSIKTCVFYFIKKKEINDILKIKIKRNKEDTKEIKREYLFCDNHQTSKIRFYEYNEINDTNKLLVKVPIKKIKENSYSLNYAEYIKDEIKKEQSKDIVIKTLGEVCSIDYGTRIVKKDNIKGVYPVYGSGKAMFSTDTFNRDGFNILIGRFALSLECVRFINEKIFLNDSGLSVKSKIDILLHKYIGYYLLHNQNLIYNCARGTAQKNLDIDEFKSIKIPIPSLERQQEIVKYLDFIYEKANKTSNDKITELKQLNEFCLNNQKIFGDNVVKTLGEVCNFKNGKGIKKDTLIEGEYPVIGGGQKPMGFHNEYNTNENTILCSSSGAYAGFISKYDKKVWASDCFSIIPKDKTIKNNYLYYFLKITQDKIYKSQTGTAQPHVYSKDLQDLKIHIPTLERQKEIVEYCEYNDKLIKDLEKEIENNKKIAKEYLSTVLNLDKFDNSNIKEEPITEDKDEEDDLDITED
jgi:type I restriction-modification system DNA methylase subunit/restriction endonuclease S subunit